ncbi:ribonuclease J [Reinekea marinisedimentorum]|uniref:Ribonuclease J n=1 Tax=Reinekea marinisedimentorum TaxID=230495 RepID=A0A4R3IFD5_9GAMM|nr:ribonuclease J [Reinekea marinisedimentorum]TCS43672.1 ribonuclease J [Reinekea marinisedimentorum]
MNLNLYGHNGQWLIVDCGMTFNEPLTPDSKQLHELVAANPQFIADRKEQLAGMVITHGHEDHIGAVAQLWPRLQCPVYTTAFTAEILTNKLNSEGLLSKVPLTVVPSGSRVEMGCFCVEWLPVTHSIPDSHSIVIRTPAANVLHTADWKIDPDPVVGDPFNADQFKELAQENITAMVCDSTNAVKPGHSESEGDCYEGLLNHIQQAKGRVVVSCFGSNIARLITLGRIAQQTGRYMALLGRSMQTMYRTARRAGLWPEDLTLADSSHLSYLLPEEVLAVATGSQGEPRTALNRLANDRFYDFEISAGDTVIFSSMVIPGNEQPVQRLVEQLKRKEIRVIESADSEWLIHASGHPCADELAKLYEWVKPKVAVPVHGEREHLLANASIARRAGVQRQLTGKDGDIFILNEPVGVRPQQVTIGRIAINQS